MIIKNEEYYLNEVKQYGWALECVPETLRTEKICLAAVKQSGCALRYVPETLRTEKICLAAVKQNGRALKFVPETLRTEKICLAAVKQNGWALECVPETLKIVYQFERYTLSYMNGIDILKGGCTSKTFEEWLDYEGENEDWLDYEGENLGEYDLNYLNTVTKPFIKSILDNRNITKN